MSNLIISGGVTLSGGFGAGFGGGPALSVMSGLWGWFKADSLSLADGASLTSWADDSGSVGSANFQTILGVAAPNYVASSINNKPAVRNDQAYGGGTGKAMVLNRKLPNSNTIFIVAKASASASGTGTLYSAQGGYADGVSPIATRWSNGNLNAYHSVSDYSVLQPTIGTVNSNPFILSTETAAGTSFVHKINNGTPVEVLGNAMAIGTSANTGATKTFIFNFYAWNFVGDIAEFIVYDRVLTPSEMTSVYSYLGSKYGISV